MTKTILNKLVPRVKRRDKKIARAERTFNRVLPPLKEDVIDLGVAVRGLEELIRIFTDIYLDLSSGVGHLEEAGEELTEARMEHAQDATVIMNLIPVFMKSHPDILTQVLETIDDQPLRDALAALEPKKRRALLNELHAMDNATYLKRQ